jgi:hypothetical protein
VLLSILSCPFPSLLNIHFNLTKIHSGHGSEVISVGAGECLEVSVYTRSTQGATFSLYDDDKKSLIIDNVTAVHTGANPETDVPTSMKIMTKPIQGPVNVKVKADSLASRFTSHNFLLVFTFKNK